MRNFANITVVTVNGMTSGVEAAVESVKLSCTNLPGSRGLVLAPYRPNNLDENFSDFIQIAPMSYFEYSIFIIYALHHFVKTDFCLIVQDDGWVLNGDNWNDDFYLYDYIGAPIHLAFTRKEYPCIQYRQFSWVDKFRDHFDDNLFVVQNGGFTLRSKALLEAPTKFNIDFKLNGKLSLGSVPYRMRWLDDINLEDVQLCIAMRPQLEQVGLKFAPINVAKYFSVEHFAPVLHDNFDPMKLLGHHCKLRKMLSAEDKKIDYLLQESEFELIYGEQMMRQLLENYGYQISLNKGN